MATTLTPTLAFKMRGIGDQYELAEGRNWGHAINDDLQKIDEVIGMFCNSSQIEAIKNALRQPERPLEVF